MNRSRFALTVAATLALALCTAAPVAAAPPVRDGDAYTDTFADDLIFDLCGIETLTTVTERWTFTEFSDGSAMLHVVRTFVPEDPRIPIEKGAATRFVAPDGTETLVGKAIQVFQPDGGIRILDAGLVEFGDELTVRGPHPFLDVVDLAELYCP